MLMSAIAGNNVVNSLARGVVKRPASDPPSTETGTWSRDVNTVSNYGRERKIAFYKGEFGFCWQRTRDFEAGEKVEYWWEDVQS